MPLMSDPRWYQLTTTTCLPPSSPPLLIQRCFTANAYKIYITDLTYIWGESLSRKEILQRALNEDTTIDPSEDASQMKVFLETLQRGLSLSDADDDADEDIELDIALSSARSPTSSKSTGVNLELKLTCQLKPPLQPFVWTFKLQPQPQKSLTGLLLFPLLSFTSSHTAQVRDLLQTVKEKDLVIEKFRDALEESRISIQSALGASSSRRRGLEKFDEGGWRKKIRDLKSAETQEQMLNSVFGTQMHQDASRDTRLASNYTMGLGEEWLNATSKSSDLGLENEDPKHWWEKINGERKPRGKKSIQSRDFASDEDMFISPPRKRTSAIAKTGKSPAGPIKVEHTTSESTMKGKSTRKVDMSSSEDEFETHVTPPPPTTKQRSAQPPVLNKIEDNESMTEASEGDDLDIPSVSNASSSIRPAIRKTSSPDAKRYFIRSPTPPEQVSPPRDFSFGKVKSPLQGSKSPRNVRGSKSPPNMTRQRSPVPMPPAHMSAKKKGGLGSIGGKKKEATPPPPLSPPARNMHHDDDRTTGEEDNLEVPVHKPIGKIGGKIGGKVGGKIGGKKSVEANDGKEGEEVVLPTRLSPVSRGSPSRRAQTPEVKREATSKNETSTDLIDEEAADRKRRQLQLELEAKQKAPVKKKRKF